MNVGGKRAGAREGVSRRRILKALALAPAAAAGCAANRAERKPPEGERASADPRGGLDRAPIPAAAAIRAFPIARDADPAFVFRAAAARPGDPR